MKSGIKVVSKVEKQTIKELGAIICDIFSTGYQNRMDQSTICEALALLKNSFSQNVSVNNCSVVDNNSESEHKL
jgi:hypothetical protein